MPKKRSNGEGTLRERPNGLWECTIMIGVQDSGQRKYKSFYARTQKGVKEKVRKFQEEQAAGLTVNDKLTFGQWADQWYEGYKGSVAASTYESYRYTLNILKDGFGNKVLSTIKAIDIERFLKQMAVAGRSQSYLSKMRGMLFQIMKKAEANDLIHKNPVACADKMKAQPKTSKKDAFTAEEIDLLSVRLPDDRIGNSIRVLLATGMRTQELLALEPKHIEPDGSCIHIRQAVTMVKGTPQLGPPKSQNSYRDIPVPEKMRSAVLALRSTTERYIWSNPRGRFCNPRTFRKQFKEALQAVGGVRLLSPHYCRHTFVSQLQASGVPLETIQGLSGHADIDMTEHYLHIQQQVKEEAVNRLNHLF